MTSFNFEVQDSTHFFKKSVSCHLLVKLKHFFFTVKQPYSKKCWVVSTHILVKYGQTQMLG